MPWSYRPALDGLRTVAVYAVLLFHTGHPWALGGFVGVDLFFVLSGFLVTSVLLSEIDRTGTLKVGMFYTRRVRRLLPAAVVAIVATCAVFVLVAPVTDRVELVRDAQSALLYVANWHFLAESGDYFATDVDRSPFLHFWSLAIEEQFYLVFPLVLLLAIRGGRRRRAVAVLTALMLASVVAQLVWAQVDPTHAYYGTDARIYQPLAGAVLALVVHRLPLGGGRRWAFAATAGLAGFLLLSSGLVDITPSWRGLAATVAAVSMVAAVSVADGGALARGLAQPVLVFLGKISYGTYLWHWPVILVLQEVFATSPRVVAVLTVAISTGLAALSYEVLEKPIRTTTLLDRFRWSPAVVGVAMSAILAFTVVPGLLTLDRKPALTADSERSQALPTPREVQLPADVDWSSVVADRGDVGSCPPDDPEGCIDVEGSGPHVLLVGDSQAQSLVPMFRELAEDHDLTLSLNVVPGCLWQEDLVNEQLSPQAQKNCERSRVGWYDEALPVLEPDVVVLMTRPRDNEKVFGEVISRRDGKKMPLDTMTLRASRSTLEKLEELAPRVLIVNRIVMPETFDPADCLTTERSPANCAVPVPVGGTESDSYAETLATASATVDMLDLNPAFCPGAPVCMPVVGEEVVWRDDHHVTASFATSRRDTVWRILSRNEPFRSHGGT